MTNGGAMLGLCGIALLWLVVFHALSAERERVVQSAVQNASNLSRAFEEHIIRSIKAVDQTLLFIRQSYEKDPNGFDMTTWVQNTKALTDMTFQIAMIDRFGIMRSSNLGSAGSRVDLSDREHFRVHLDDTRDDLFISKPVFGRVSGKWSIQMTRKMVDADGHFDGVVVMSVDPQYLSRFYDSVDIGRRGIVLLAGVDGIVRTRSSKAEDGSATGRSLIGNPLFTAFATAQSGTFTANSQVDGVRRIYVYRGVLGFPLILSVGVEEGEVLAGYEANRQLYIGLAIVLSAFLLIVVILLIVRQARLDRALEQLRVSEASYAQKSRLLETTLETMGQGIIMVDASHHVQVCNERAIRKLGLPKELMAGSPHFDDVLRWQWEHREFGANGAELGENLRSFIRSEGWSDQPHAYERTRPDGMVLEIRGMPLPTGGVVRTYTDITLRKQNEEMLRQARDQANEASRVKSEFLATMSHEIRSPMSGMVGVLELLRETNLDLDQSRMAGMVHQSALALLSVLNDVLDFSKIEARALSILLEPVCLNDLVTEVVQPYAMDAARKGIRLTMRGSSQIPAWVEIDPLRLRQILNNLLANAVKFTAAGDITLDIGCYESPPRLRFSVQDSGCGMSEDVLARLFEPFTQADGSTARDFGGTGLGLCISRRLARLLDGDLTVTSKAGTGSTFTLLIPLVATSDATAVPAEIVTGKFQYESVPGERRVLVVDDDPTNRWLTQRQLEVLGLDAHVAENGMAALQMLGKGGYRLLVTDCHMPGMDGVALTRAVRAEADPVLRNLPIIGLTADATAVQRGRCEDAGMTGVAIKPINRAQLSDLLARHLPVAGLSDPLVPAQAGPGSRAVAPFNPETYLDIFSPGEAEGEKWLARFLEGSNELIHELGRMLATESIERDAITDAAHRLKGTARSVGAIPLGAAAMALEEAATEADVTALRALHEELAEELLKAEAAVAAFLSDIQVETLS